MYGREYITKKKKLRLRVCEPRPAGVGVRTVAAFRTAARYVTVDIDPQTGERYQRFVPKHESQNGDFFTFAPEQRQAYKRFRQANKVANRLARENGLPVDKWNAAELYVLGYTNEVEEYLSAGKALFDFSIAVKVG